jgi:putative glutamine amidotransferase
MFGDFMRRIGIPMKYNHLSDGRCILYLGEKVRRTIQKAGGFIVPIVQVQDVDYCDTKFDQFKELTEEEKETIEQYLDMVDGVLFPGGHKITPFDYYLLERCIERNIPTLGICLGMQLMSCYKEEVFKVYPNESDVTHYQEKDEELSHKVIINRDSKLYSILGKEEILVNSFHKYHATPNELYDVCATCSDGYIEGIEIPSLKFHLGIQWHPEISYDFDEDSKKIIDAFIKACEVES